MPKREFPVENRKIALPRASMVINYYIKLFRTRADRRNGILMSLLFLVAETIIHKCSNLTLRSQTLANITEIFENAYHVDLHFTKRHRVFLHTLPVPCFSAEAYSEPLKTSTMECFCVSS